MKDTEFIPLAQEGKAGQFHHFPLASRSKSVVALSLAASAVNLWVATPGIVCTLHRVAAKFIPHCLMVPLMELFLPGRAKDWAGKFSTFPPFPGQFPSPP